MPIAVNKNTTQSPMTALGQTGTQVVKWIPAPRVYVTAAQSLTNVTIPTTMSNGVTPTGWTDLGIVDGVAAFAFTRKLVPINCGLDGKLRKVVTESVQATVQFSLSQLDDIATETITASTPTVITGSGKTVGATYFLGQNALPQLAVLLVVQNKFGGKEWQYFTPAAFINFDFSADSSELQVTGYLPWFKAAGQSKEAAYSATIFSTDAIGVVTTGTGFGLSPFGTVGFGL